MQSETDEIRVIDGHVIDPDLGEIWEAADRYVPAERAERAESLARRALALAEKLYDPLWSRGVRRLLYNEVIALRAEVDG